MARKNLLTSVLDQPSEEAQIPGSKVRSDYARRGASRSMMISIDEMAENAKKMMAGEAIVSLDPALLDASFVSDRIDHDDEDYFQLREAIRTQGQATPILVRPHPSSEGRYMIVFGHRRVRVARELKAKVRAVVKNFEDIAHIIAQGQENTARANLSFIEKALFARKLLAMGQGKDTIKSALTIDDTLLSRMLSVAETVPVEVLDAIGAAKSVGRDRWEDLKKLVTAPAKAAMAKGIVRSDEFKTLDGVDRFNFLLAQLKATQKSARRAAPPASYWAPEDKAVEASFRRTGKTFNLSLTSKHGGEFGEFLSARLEQLYSAFKAQTAIKEANHGTAKAHRPNPEPVT